MSDKKDLMGGSALTPALEVNHEEQAMLEKMAETRTAIQAQFLNRVNHPMMNLTEEQKVSMGIELTLGAGFALSEVGHPLGPVFINDATVMSQVYAERMRQEQEVVVTPH